MPYVQSPPQLDHNYAERFAAERLRRPENASRAPFLPLVLKQGQLTSQELCQMELKTREKKWVSSHKPQDGATNPVERAQQWGWGYSKYQICLNNRGLSLHD